MTAREDIGYLVGSASRVAILRALSEASDGPTGLADRCSCARETAQRTLAGFVDRGWVEKRDGAYRITPAGELVLNGYDDLVWSVETADRLGEFFVHTGDFAADVPPDVFGDLTVTTATAERPLAAVERFLSVLGEAPAERFIGVTPAVSQVFNQQAESVITPETAVELVIDDQVLTVSQDSYSESLDLAYELDNMHLYLSEEELTAGLAVVDGHAWVGAYDGQGNLVACIDSEDPDFVEWVTDRFETYRESATLLEREFT